eukprot:295751-Chlamydomonas_euryale.AAC.1
MSGAEPCTGSKIPGPSPEMDADGSRPSEPASIDASSDRMSPKMLPGRGGAGKVTGVKRGAAKDVGQEGGSRGMHRCGMQAVGGLRGLE